MENEKLICKACGNDSFATGEIGGQGNVRPIGSFIAVGSPLILTFCKDCGEVASFKVENPTKFK